MSAVIIQNSHFRLILGENAEVESLICLDTLEECLMLGEDMPFASVTLPRPYNNEIKLSHPNKETTFRANRVRREGNKLIVGFEIAPFEAVIGVDEAEDSVIFTHEGYVIPPEAYGDLHMTPPPVQELTLLQLSVKNRERFGEWLNISWDDVTSVCVAGACPEAMIDSEKRRGFRVMRARAVKGVRMRGTRAALMVSATPAFMDCMDAMEARLGLPRGVQSRRSPWINRSVYWSGAVTPENVDEHIRRAKQGGFSLMLMYYSSFFKEGAGYSLDGNYDYRPEYPGGKKDLEAVIKKITDAGILPGLHVLQTHIGLESRYVTPVADHRLNLTRHFTLAKPLSETDDTVFVEEDPEDAVMADGCRILMFGGELISYTGYTTERPYRFTGCGRGDHKTNVVTHPMGQIGGILDVSEFGATSVYLDQESSLADEIADKIADAYSAGFRFMYFDGSEGTDVPFGYNVPRAQYRVWKKLDPAPLFTEGAAKAHFGWHFLSGGNAFDIFPPDIFKGKIDEFPLEEAPRMRQDLTRLNFGWWGFWTPGTQPDHIEYGTSRAAAWDCPATMQVDLEKMNAHPRIDDILETMRRWEEVRARGLLTEEDKEKLKVPQKEYTLIPDGNGGCTLTPWEKIPCGAEGIRAFLAEEANGPAVIFWHESGESTIRIALGEKVSLTDDLTGVVTEVESEHGYVTLKAKAKTILRANVSREILENAFKQACDQ